MPAIRRHLAGAALAAAAIGLAGGAAAQSLLFWSTQANPIEETQAMRDQVLSGFEGGAVEFQSSEPGPFLTRIQAELQAGEGTIAVLGTLHGDFAAMPDDLADLSSMDLQADAVLPALMELGQLGTEEQKYVPWMQATYIMAANQQALEHLPDGADVNALTYDQLVEWAANMAEATGGPKFGFPAGPEGLKHRFFEGYLLPAYTGSTVTAFRSEEAVQAWEKFRELWQYTSPASTSYNFMQEPLITGDVWVAFDHTARLAEAFNQRPDEFVAFPAPAGPAGRAFMPVIAGMGIPVTAPDPEAALELINYMLEPETQIATLRATNFFPVMEVELPEDVPPSVSAAGEAISIMTAAEDALPALLPVGLGELGGQFDRVYVDAFERIVLANQDIQQVLDSQAEELRRIIEEAGAPCWPPDEPSEGPCPVD
jgi:multiple sugar transport system substrate-binding protein